MGDQPGAENQPGPDNQMDIKGAADLVARILEGPKQGGKSWPN
jgi:hypothetical protein